ncbi:S-layer homology domain-containing protein [Lutispora saccharofermentans]|uniref:S-layer homology domain-containing protein n=1 Tax=Lutispora saccharofermentans TaxID=3024236 RepID=A0ABT1NDM8_9FIRM|nr:S-layer homology domain-containing protein [Lutispora saccharofermentans]MCQ1529349.1 S-layer homology domain-containing protein [Lutispora saccharofermentans]
MHRKISTILLAMIMICAMAVTLRADIEPPVSFGAPEHFGVGYYISDSLYFTFSVPEDMRDYIERRAADDPDNKQSFSPHFQIDYKIDNGSWHHIPGWDSPKTMPNSRNSNYFTFANGKRYVDSDRWSMTGIFEEEESFKQFEEQGWDYLKSHFITFRVRFAESFDYGETYTLSPWSKEFILSANIKADYNKLINHAPTLLYADLKATASGEPYFDIKLEKHPGDVQDLHSMSGSSVRAEIWMRRAGDKDFKFIRYEWVNSELLHVEASDYFSVDNSKQSYEDEGYEIKVCYALDLRRYKPAGIDSTTSVDIYGPFSNVISHNMPAWSEASTWAAAELKKADEYGLIPDSLKGADMTKPITREEFAELAVKLYEKTTNMTAVAASPNPFTDTANAEILKAFKLGITTGTSATTFAPKALTNREQVATMLSRAIRVMAPGEDFSAAGAPSFTDEKDISPWASEHVKFMSKNGIIKGADGKFMPKAITTAQTAAGYATTTREQAIAMSVRSYEQFKDISTAAPSGSSTNSVAGTWVLGTLSGGTFNAVSGKYEGGASGLGQIYTFKGDGTYTALVIWSNAMYLTGSYSVKDGVLTLTDRVAEESDDDGKSWSAEEKLPDSWAYFNSIIEGSEKYLLIGQEGAAPPLVDKANALKYKLKE